jgi:hypothetical protein
MSYRTPHLLAAAFRAISFLLLADRLDALAFPPLLAPSLDSATPAGLRVSGAGGSMVAPLPVAASTTPLATCVKSRRVLARVGMA